MEILRSVGDYSGQKAFGGWVRSIAVSKCLMYLRSPWHRSVLWLETEAGCPQTDLLDRAPTPESETALRARPGARDGGAARPHTQRGVAARRRRLYTRRDRAPDRAHDQLLQISARTCARSPARAARSPTRVCPMHARIDQLLSLRDGVASRCRRCAAHRGLRQVPPRDGEPGSDDWRSARAAADRCARRLLGAHSGAVAQPIPARRPSTDICRRCGGDCHTGGLDVRSSRVTRSRRL